MLTVDFRNIHKVHSRHGLSRDAIKKQGSKLPKFLKRIHKKDQGFYRVIDDLSVVKEIESYARKQKGKFDHIVVLGIGGSALGMKCLRQSLGHLYQNGSKKTPTLHVLDNIDPNIVLEMEDVITLKRTLFVVISKSGTTPEPLSKFLYFKNKLKRAKLSAKKHMVFVTDPEKGFLVDVAAEEGITTFTIPPNVGGRFSVLTPVGLLPAALIGLDIKNLLRGAREMRDQFVTDVAKENLPFQVATVQYLLAKKGKTINVMMPYAQKLIRFADWYRQLLAESIGKAVDNKGKAVHVGITPVNALGATDQHSQSQLYNEGPNDKCFMFLRAVTLSKKVSIPMPYPKDTRIAFMKGATFNKLIAVEQEATAMSYTKNDRPNMTITVDRIDAYHLGQLFMLFEGATAFLGEYYNINAFNQPGVELAKKLTMKYLPRK